MSQRIGDTHVFQEFMQAMMDRATAGKVLHLQRIFSSILDRPGGATTHKLCFLLVHSELLFCPIRERAMARTGR
jgi:hypothetical protein